MKSLGYGFLVIVDGFDRFSLGQMIKPKQQHVFSELGNYIFLNKALRMKTFGAKLSFSMLVTLRRCTYNYYPREDSYESCRVYPQRRYLAPVGIHKVIERSVNYYFYEISESDSDYRDQMVSSLVSIMLHIKGSLGFDSNAYPEDIISLFNNNYRRFNRFLVAVISDLLSHLSRYDKIKTSERECVEQLSSLVSDSIFLSSYYKKEKVLQLFVLSGKKSFNNYYSYGRVTLDEVNSHRVSSNRGKHGLIDNIFDYDDISVVFESGYRNDNGCSLLLLKLRILQIINLSHSKSSTASSIHDKLLKIGYTSVSSVSLVEDFLDKLNKSSFLKSSKFVTGSELISYRITPIGEFVIQMVADFELNYVENVVQKTLFPEFIRDWMLPASKYAPQVYNQVVSEEGMAGLTLQQHWVFCSSFNSLVFFQYLLSLEMMELRYIKNSEYQVQDESLFIFNALKDKSDLLEGSPIKRYRDILSTRIASSFIDVDELNKRAECFIDSIQKVA